MNEKKSAFTLIELLIVVAIIAILAAIAVPNFLEAQVRSKVSRAQSDMRSLATAIEAYSVDHNAKYPVSTMCSVGAFTQNYDGGTGMVSGTFCWDNDERFALPAGTININYGLIAANPGPNLPITDTGITRVNLSTVPAAATRQSFTVPGCILSGTPVNVGLHTLTTPTAYITSYPPDPFANTKGLSFGYAGAKSAWALWSFGPDMDEAKSGGQLGWGVGTNGIALTGARPVQLNNPQANACAFPNNPWNTSEVSARPLDYQNGTYDTTNGSRSEGDVIRLKQ